MSSADAVDVGYLRSWALALGVAERLREVVPERRVAMCLEMSQAARAIVRRSLESAGLDREEVASRLVARLYGSDLAPEALAACQRSVAQAAARNR